MDRLVRSRRDKMLAGVCGGLANYFNIDSAIIRLIFVVAVLSGVSPLVYVVLWIVMPEEAPQHQGVNMPAQLPTQSTQPHQDPTGEWQFDPYTGEQIRK